MSHMSCRITFYMAPSFNLTVNSGFPSTRTNLSPFTKDFRGGEQLNESIYLFFVAPRFGGAPNNRTRLNTLCPAINKSSLRNSENLCKQETSKTLFNA